MLFFKVFYNTHNSQWPLWKESINKNVKNKAGSSSVEPQTHFFIIQTLASCKQAQITQNHNTYQNKPDSMITITLKNLIEQTKVIVWALLSDFTGIHF